MPSFEIISEIDDIEPIAIGGSIRDQSMTTRKAANRQFAICVDNFEYPASLELHKIYQVIPDEDAAGDGDLRVIDES